MNEFHGMLPSPQSSDDRTEARIPDYLLAPLRRWRLTLACLVLSAFVAAGVAYRYGQRVWQVEGTILYTPLSSAGLSHGDYTPPNPQTLISLVKSSQRCQKVIDELGLPVSARTLDRSLKVNQQANVDAVRLSLAWPDPETGRAIVDRLTEAYIQDMAELRRVKIRETLALLEAGRATHSEQLAEARAAYAKLPDKMTRPRLQSEHERHTAAATALTTELNLSTERLSAGQRKMARLREAVAANELQTIDEDGAYRDRKQRLLEAIRTQEGTVQETDVAIEAKKKELAIQEKLVNSGAGARLDHARVSGELDALTARRRTAATAAEESRKELAELPRRQARLTLVQLEDEQTQLELKIAALKRELDANREAMVRLGELSATEHAAAKKVEQAEGALQALAGRITEMERLRDGPVTEFAAAHPAVVSDAASNRKMLATLVLGVLMSVSLLGLIGHAWLTQQARPKVRVRACGLPVIAEVDHGASLPGSCRPAIEARRLALQLREPVRRSGGLVLFAPADQTIQTEDVVWQLARYLALWGEAVLILDARARDASASSAAAKHDPDAPSRNGSSRNGTKPERSLSDVLVELGVLDGDPSRNGTDSEHSHAGRTRGPADCVGLRVADAAALVRKIGRTGIAYLPARAAFPDADSLASAAMQSLLVRLSEQYDRVLLIGPPLDESLGAEILATYADGAVVMFHRDGEESAECRRAAEAIRAAGVPWVGATVRSSRRCEGDDDLPFALEILQPADGREAGWVAPRGEQLPDEEPSVLSIAWSQASGFGGNPPGPLEPEAADPPRGAPHSTDQHVEGGADLKAYGNT
jgi:Mrp family chromosome partitioning ATPase/uncharacterized protein involved in exopolysaccharide biosynthesis